jgi:hypothetical protein
MAQLLSDTANWVSGYVQGMPISAFTGLNPLVEIASMVRATILAPPFNWAFNRESFTITTVAGQQDYTISPFTDFGYVEKAAANDGTTSWQITEILNTEPLSLSTNRARPLTMAVQEQYSGGGGGGGQTTSVTFRFSAVPDAVYTVEVIYQKAPVLFAALSDNWDPLPNEYSIVYNNLVLGEILADADDPRAQVYRQRGVAILLNRSEGLTAEDKAVFMAQYLALGVGSIAPAARAQQATQARAI